jgi:Calx-beta domain/Bacterial Ig domain
MQQSGPRSNSVLRIFAACLLVWLLIVMPLVPLTPGSWLASAAGNREAQRSPQSADASRGSTTVNSFANAPVPQPAPEPMFAPTITATKDDGLPAATTVAPGGTINYTVTINNTGVNSPADDATNVNFSDQIDPSTTLVPGSPVASVGDKYTTIGNVQISVPDGATDLLGNDFDPDTGTNAGMTATAETKSSTSCTGGCSNNVTINANGSFTYDPPLGFSGTDTFTYTANSGSSSVTATVKIVVANKIWFISNNAGACTSNCDGRLSHPFTSLSAFNAANLAGPGQPGDNDWIFVFESPTAYTGPITLRNGQKLIGQDATASIISLTSFTQPSGTDPLPAVNSANGTIVQITTSAAATNGINLASGNTLRGFTVGNTTGAKISGNNFGTLIVGNSALPDVTLNGSGQALNLTSGTLSTAGRFASVTTTSSAAQGINLAGIADSDGPGGNSFQFGSTTVSGSTTQGILVGTSTADLNFGNTSVTGGVDAISLQNNSNGTRTFGNISTSGNTGVGFLHGTGGGAVSVTGTTTITNPGGNGIDIDSSNANISFAGTTVSKNSGGIGVDLTNNASRTISFSSLAVTTTTGFAINANNSGTVNVTTGSLSQTGAGGGAASLTGTALGMTFTTVSSDGGVNGLLFSGGSGTFAATTTNLQNNTAIGLSMASTAVAANFGNTTVNSSAGAAVNLSSNTANITFGALNLSPDANFRGLDAQNNTGTITSTSGNIAATGAAAIFIDGPAGRTPLAMVLTNVDSTNSTADGLNLTDVSGTFTVNDPGTATGIVNPTGTGITVNNSAAAVNFGNTSVTGSGNANGDDTGTGIFLTNNTGATTFGSLTVTPDTGERGLFATDTDAATAAGAITIGSGTITTTNDIAIQITGASAAARTPLNIQLTTVNTTGGATAANGIALQNTSATGSPGGFRVLGNGGACDAVTTTCTGGRITNTTGADGATGGIGISLNTVDKVVFTRMRLDNHTNFALRGFTVTGFVMDTCLVDGTNGNNASFFEGSVVIDSLFGTAAGSNSNLITGSTIKGGWGDNIRVSNNTSTASELTITSSTIRDTNTGTNGNDNVHIDSHLNANMKVAITNSTFAATNGDHIQTIADGTSNFTIVATGNTLSGGGGVNALGQGITISGGDISGTTDSTEVVRFNISNNTMNGTIQGGAININEGVGNGNWQGQVSSNIIGTAAVNGSGASQSAGIRVENHSKGTLTAIVSSNTVRQWSTQGINLQAGDTSATGLTNGPLNVTVTSNTVANPNPASAGDHGIQLNIGTQTGNTNTVCANYLNNNSLGNAVNGGVDYRLRQRQNTTVQLPGYTGVSNNTAAVRTYILGRPNTANQANPNDVAASVSGTGGGYVNTPGPGNPCAQPTVPTAPAVVSELLLPASYGSSEQKAESAIAANVTNAPASQPAVSSNEPSLFRRAIVSMVNFAGAVSAMIMPTAQAAELTAPTETAQPLENVQQQAKVRSHHAIIKKTENANHASTSSALATPMANETVSATIPTLPADSTVTIKFSVTVNNPPALTLLGPPRVENQGTVTANGGISVLTDDPDFGGANDKTRTLIDLFNTTTSVQTSGSPSNQGDSVTFTATVSENPSQGSADPTGTVQFLDGATPLTCSEGGVNGVRPLSGGTAACTTNAITPAGSPHTINANYSGDGNFDPSSGSVQQTVLACTTNPVVTSTGDSGAGTLRDALASVCTGGTITFSLGAGPHTITLTSGELAVAKNVTIKNNTGDNLTVSGGNLLRVFNINSGKTAAIIGLTISGGTALNGGGILNDGTLTVVNSTVTGNNATADGAGIGQTATATSLTLINTTISGNNANGYGGGVDVLGGTATIINSTITNNHGDNDDGGGGGAGGLRRQGGTVTLKNTIVAGNFVGSSTSTRNDIEGAIDGTSSNNLIGDGTNMTGITNGTQGNQVGSSGSPINPQLGPLANNGGLTQTHALLPTSPAVEKGSNANLPADTFDLDGDLDTAEALPVDQRGLGFPRNADSFDADTTQVVDIGAFELHPSIEDIPNQSTSEDTAKLVVFNLGDDTGTLITGPGGSVTATSSNTTLVPNANLGFTGSGGSRTLQITPASGQSGTTTITVTVTATNGRTATDTFDLSVGTVNDPPAGTDNTVTTNEDTVYTFTVPDFGFTDPNDSPANNLLAVKITTLPGAGTLTNNNVAVSAGDFIPVANISGGLLKFTPVANANGTPYTSFTFQVQDDGGGSDLDPTPNTMTINVTAINDPPSFTIAANPPTVNQDAGPQTVNNFATNISAGPNEAGQTLTFNVSPTGSTGTLTFSTAPAINSTTGTLTYTATNGTSGTATFSVTLSDNGSNTPPNSNTSGAQSFTITVVPPNASPVVTTTAGNLAYTENAPATAIDPALTVTDSDDANLTGATVSIGAGFDNAQDTLAFTNQLGITGNYNSGTGVLTLSGTAAVTSYQAALRTVTYQNSSDNPTASRTITFTATDGISIPGSATRGIAITAVNDAPVNTVPGPQTTNEDTAKVFSISVADVDLGANPIKITLTATNGKVSLSGTAGLSFTTGTGTNDTTMVFTGSLANVNTALTNLSFNPTPDFNGAASLQIVSDDQGNTGTGGALTDTDSVTITVNAANDAPVVTATAGNLSYTENDPATAIDPGLTVTDVDSTNLTGATVAITGGTFVSGQDVLAFTNQLGITGNYNSGTGVLTLSGPTTVANYQTALRSVKYQNTSDDPSTATRTVTFTANDGTNTSSATRGIDITAVNDAPVNTVPGPQGTNQNTPLTFSSGNGNQISVTDADAGTNAIQVTLTVTNGTLTLNGGGAGLSFTVGDGTADSTMTFTGTIANINTAMNGMTYTPNVGFNGAATLTITSNDQGNTGSGGAKSDTDTVNIQIATNISIQDASLAEPKQGTANMIFTVTLSAPAPAGGSSVNYTTQDIIPASINTATAGQDYTATSGTVNFAAGEQFKTILVSIKSDNKKGENNESFQVVLSNPVNATIADGTAIGTIIENDQPGTILISELRTSGPAGAGDDFVEVYNNSDSPHTVNGTGGGYGLFKMGATCGDTPVLLGVIPNGTVIPGRGHFLFVGSAYSLANYGGTGAAAGDVTMLQDIENDRNVAIFSTASPGGISSANRLDAVGFGANTGGSCDLFREGTTLTPLSGSTLEYSYFRDECGKKGNPSVFGNCPTGGMTKDSNVNGDDFIFIDTQATATPAGQRLGAPGPQNLGSPRMTFDIVALLLDSSKNAAGTPNRVRDTTAIGPNAATGTMSIRRRFQNNTGAPVSRLRIRVVDISTTFVSGGVADLRLLSSGDITVNVNDSATCTAAGFASTPCNVPVLGTTLETPPNQPLGGGFNSSATTSTITLGTPLAPGASVNLQLLLGVQGTGSFKFFFNVEALP